MGMKYNKKSKKQRNELLEEWYDVYGVNYDMGFMTPDYDEELENVIIGFNVTSLKKEGEQVDILLALRPEDACFLVEEFLNEYQALYLNHIAARISDE